MRGTDRRAAAPGRGLLLALLMVVSAAGVAAQTAAAAEPGGPRGFQLALGPAGSFTDGDPLGGAYAAVRLPASGPWALGLDSYGEYGQETVSGVKTEDYKLAGLVAVDRDLSDLVQGPEQLSLQAGLRAGVVIERDETAERTRTQPYPSVGLYGTAGWYVAPRVALESRVSLDVGAGTRLGLGLGLRFGR